MPDTVPPSRSSQDSRTEMTELVLPTHANSLGTVFGGVVMSWIDVCGAIAAQRHCGRVAVTAAIDDVQFRAPIYVGEVVRLTARVNAAFRTSVEVGVRVEKQNPRTGEHALCVDALLTFVALDEARRPTPVPVLSVESEEDRRCARDAAERKALRLARKTLPAPP